MGILELAEAELRIGLRPVGGHDVYDKGDPEARAENGVRSLRPSEPTHGYVRGS